MASTPRFIVLWTLASVPLPLILDVLLPEWLRRSPIPFDPLLYEVSVRTILGGFVAAAQSLLLACVRRPTRAWVAAMVAAELLSQVAQLSLVRQANDVLGPAASPAWVTGLLFASTAASRAILFATAQAFALWGRRWPPSWRLWIGGRVAWSVAVAIGAALALSPDTAALGYAPSDVLGRGAYLTAEAVGTAWLLDRVVFREGTVK